MAKWHGMDPRVRLVSISKGADFEIDLAGFPDPAPAFAYVDDCECPVEVSCGFVDRVEIYYVRPDGSAELIHQNDFRFK